MAERDDFLDNAMKEIFGDNPDSNPSEPPAPAPEPVSSPVEAPPVQQRQEAKEPVSAPAPVAQKEFTAEEILREFNKISGTNFDNVDSVKSFAEKIAKIPEIEEQSKLIPELIDALEKVQNPLNYFSDEIAYKVSQLSKDGKFQGKENILNEILRSNLNELSDLKVIELAARLNAASGMRNPFRAEIKSLNLDPDYISDNEDLDDDTKDALLLKADQYRKQLSQLGSDVKAPTFEGTVVERLLNEKKASREDREARMTQLLPAAKAIISEIKEIPVTDDFKFQLGLNPTQVESYSKELADLMISGQYDLSTEAGKAQLFSEVMNMFKTDYFEKVVQSLASHIASRKEEEMRRMFNNEAPLRKGEPTPTGSDSTKDWITQVAEQMVSQGY